MASIGCPDFHSNFVIENTAGYSECSMKFDMLNAVVLLCTGTSLSVSWFVVCFTLHML